MKGPTRKDDVVTKVGNDAKVVKQKRIISSALINKTPSSPTTYDEAKATCKARKRKERQESISSLCQERKVIRSNSEERPAQKKHVENKNTIRRVSSNEDFQSQRSNSVDRIFNAASKKGSSDNKSLTYEDCEHEKRRSHERFARPLTLKGKKHTTKRLKVKCLPRTKYKSEVLPDTRDHHKKSNFLQGSTDQVNSTGFLQLHIDERGRSPSPTQELVSPVVDWSTLHEQVDCSEPLLSRHGHETTEMMPVVASNRLLSSPRNSIIATHRIYLDPDVPKVTSNIENKPQNPLDERLYKIAKQINSIKKKIKKYEIEFESKHGYRPSHAEKMNEKAIKKLYTDLGSLKRDQKHLAEISTISSTLLIVEDTTKQSIVVNLQATINEMDKKLTSKREAANRSSNIEEMSSEQLVEEKVAVQKALLYLESIHGRPNTKADRDVVRPFYDRYRTLKRMVSKLTLTNLAGNELATIHENETMNFVTPTASSSQSNDTESEKTVLPSTSTDSSDTDSSVGDNLHSMSKEELIEQLRITTEEKKELKRKIKEFELNVQLKTGKMIQKDDKAPMENFYVAYKKIKAKSRLLEALVGKLN